MASGDGTALERRSTSDYLTGSVIELVRRNNLQPGDRLPTVQVMARQFSVALPTMRESLRRLQAVGLVDIRHGSGIYLRRHTHPLVLANPHRERLTHQTVLDLLEARLHIEPHLAGLAADRVADEDVVDLTLTLEQAGTHLRGEDEPLGWLNMDFHRKVALLSGSSVLAQVIDSLVDVYVDEQMVAMRLFDDRERDHREHLSILDAVAARNPKLAKQRMHSHLKGVHRVLAARITD